MEKHYELTASSNMKYIIGLCRKSKINGLYELKVWKTESMEEINTLYVHYDMGGSRLAISNDGQYVVTAEYEDYKKGKIFVYEVLTGQLIHENNVLSRIQRLKFNEDGYIIIGVEENMMYIYDMNLSKFINKHKVNKFFYNKYGKDLILLDSNKLKYEDLVFKSSTFAYLSAVGIPNGFVVGEATGNILCYHSDGSLCWELDCKQLGHCLDMYYNDRKKIVYGIMFNPYKREQKEKKW